MNQCPRCGERLARGAVFCASCGERADRGLLRVEVVDGSDDDNGATEVRFARPAFDRRWLGALAVAALAALVIGSVLVGRGSDPSADSASTTDPRLPLTRPSTATTTRPSARPTVAGTPTSLVTAALGSGPLLGQPSRLALYALASGLVYRIDLDTGVAVEISLQVFGDQLWSTSLGVVTAARDGSLLLFPVDGGPVLTLSETPAQFLGEGPAGRLWYQQYGDGAVPSTVWSRYGAGGAAIAVDLPATVTGQVWPDGLGGVLVEAPGGIYRITASQPARRISTGVVLDARNGYLLEYGCDEAMVCGTSVRDLRTNAGRTVTPPTSDGLAGAMVSPDGRWLVVGSRTDTGGPAGPVRASGPAGQDVDLGVSINGGCMVRWCPDAPTWAPDGSWLFGVRDATTLWAWHPGLDAPRLITVPERVGDGVFIRFNGSVVPVPAG